MTELALPVGYVEKPHQALLHDGFDSARNAVVLAHRRAGKTVATVAQVIREGLRCVLPNPQVAYLAPTSVMARKIAWPYFMSMLEGVPGMVTRRQELVIEIPHPHGRLTIFLAGGESPDRLRGLYLDAVAVDEMADMPGSLITTVLRPALADRKGKLICIGTVKGRNEFWRLYERAVREPHWFTANLKPDDTGMIDADELELLRAEMSEDEFRAEMLNDPDAAVKGAYYGKAFQALDAAGQITSVPRDEQLEVVAAFDLGMNDSTAVWFAQLHKGGEVRVIDYHEHQNTGLLEIVDKCRAAHPVERWIGPHDLAVREFSTGQARIDVIRKARGIRFEVAPNLRVLEGIEAVRQVLPRSWFDAENCRYGLDALRLYRSEYRDKRGVLALAPLHDWTSHAADAFRYLVLGTKGGRARTPLQTEVDYSALTGTL